MLLGVYEIMFDEGDCVINYKNNCEHIIKVSSTKYLANKKEFLKMSSMESYSQEAFVSTQNDKLSNSVIGEEQENKIRKSW